MAAFLISPGQVLFRAPGQSFFSSAPGTDGYSGGHGGETGTGTSGNSSGGATGATSDIAVLVIGQSNALATFSAPSDYSVAGIAAAGLSPTASAGLKFFAQSASAEIDFSGGGTAEQGHGLYQPNPEQNQGTWLANPNGAAGGGLAATPSDMSDPTQWVPPDQWDWGADGQAFVSYVQGLNATQIAAISGLWVYWHETDSSRSYVEKPVFKAAYLALIAKIRTLLNKSVAGLPVFDWFPIPSTGSPQGMPMMTEIVRELAADMSNNFWIVLPQTGDCNPRGATVNSDGTWSGGQGYHLNNGDYARYVHRAMLPIARAIAASVGNAGTIPAVVGAGLGPSIAAATLFANTVTVTIAHDIGTDLIVQNQANNGVGWVLEDGHTSSIQPGALMPAIACARIDATHLLVTLPGIPANPPGACRLHYPYPFAEQYIGATNCVTDNASSVGHPSGWDAGAALADTGWNQDMPIQSPVAVTNGVAICGLPLGPTTEQTLGPYVISGTEFPQQTTYASGAEIAYVVDDGTDAGYSKPAAIQAGVTASQSALPASWVSASNFSAALWSSYTLSAPATAGTYYCVAEAFDVDGNLLARTTGSAFTVT
jgi:hypothetical protein